MHKREREIQLALEDGKEHRKLGESFHHTLGQYMDVLQYENVQDPIQGINHMMGVMRTMQTGSPQQKAKILADFVNVYGVDVRALDDILSGTPAAQQPAQPPIPPQLEQRLSQYDQMVARMQQQDQMAEQQATEMAMSEVEQFGSDKEFFNDVRHDMADMLEFYAQRGEELSLQDAYDRACALHPEISQVLRQREMAKNIAGKRRAARRRTFRSARARQRPAEDGARALALRPGT